MNDLLMANIPPYRRARGYRIYGEKGERLLDFYQDGGHAILGHRNPGIVLEIKSLLSRGQIAPYPSRHLPLAVKAVTELVPDVVEVRVYATPERALAAAAAHLKKPLSQLEIDDPAFPKSSRRNLSLWRPFLEDESSESLLLIPVLPISTPPAPAVLVFREKPREKTPPSEYCSPLSLAALRKAVFELIKYQKAVDRSGWLEFDSLPLWSRKGPYLTLDIEEEKYASLFSDMLNNGILLSPRYPGPSIIPGEYSPGEAACFRQVFCDRVG